jgi:hypothetical protein
MNKVLYRFAIGNFSMNGKNTKGQVGKAMNTKVIDTEYALNLKTLLLPGRMNADEPR